MIAPLREYPFQQRPMIVAHRGDVAQGARENSIEAIDAALNSGADMIEIDVQWTKDEAFVCYHDETLTLRDGSKRAVHDLTLQELSNNSLLDFKESPVPLISILERVQKKVYLNLEVKEYSNRDPKRFMAALESLIMSFGLTDYVLCSSFRLEFLKAASWNLPTIIIQPTNEMFAYFSARTEQPVRLPKLVEELLPSEVMAACNATSYACMLSELTEERLGNIRARNLLLSVYTITSPDEFERAISLGARALVCENPSQYVEQRNNLASTQ